MQQQYLFIVEQPPPGIHAKQDADPADFAAGAAVLLLQREIPEAVNVAAAKASQGLMGDKKRTRFFPRGTHVFSWWVTLLGLV